MRGRPIHTLVLPAIVLLLISNACLAACLVCSPPPAVASSHCHHKTPAHDPGGQPCAHQVFRAVPPSARAHWHIDVDALWIAAPSVALADLPLIELTPVVGSSPPVLPPPLILRV